LEGQPHEHHYAEHTQLSSTINTPPTIPTSRNTSRRLTGADRSAREAHSDIAHGRHRRQDEMQLRASARGNPRRCRAHDGVRMRQGRALSAYSRAGEVFDLPAAAAQQRGGAALITACAIGSHSSAPLRAERAPLVRLRPRRCLCRTAPRQGIRRVARVKPVTLTSIRLLIRCSRRIEKNPGSGCVRSAFARANFEGRRIRSSFVSFLRLRPPVKPRRTRWAPAITEKA
jgi:hypothetical protein